MFCRNCGSKISNEDEFCSKCGSKIETEEIQYISNDVYKANQEKTSPIIGSKNRYKLLFGILLIFIIIVASAVHYTHSDDRSTQDEKKTADLNKTGMERAYIKVDGKFGFINKTGNIVIKPEYDKTGIFLGQDFCPVKRDGKWGFIDRNGKMVINPQYDDASEFSPEGLAAIKVGNKWGFINKDGKIAISPKFDATIGFSEKIAPVKIGDKWGAIDTYGKIIISVKFDAIHDCVYGLIPAESGNTAFYMNKDGKVIINKGFSKNVYFGDSLAGVKISDRWGFINLKGDIVIAPSFFAVGGFNNGLCRVRQNKDGKSGYINTSGNFVINPCFDSASEFSEGMAYVKIDNKNEVIDTDGKVIYSYTD